MARDGRAQPVPPYATHGFLGNTPANGVTPVPVVVTENDDRRRRTPPPAPIVISAAYTAATPPATVLPPGPVNVDRTDQRTRYKPPDPVKLTGIPADQFGATVLPAGPFVVPLDERRRFLQALPATVTRGYDDAIPPQPTIVEPDDRRRRNRAGLDPVTIQGVPADQFVPFVQPPPTLVVFAPFDQRHYRPPDPLWISSVIGATIPFVPPPVVTVLAGTDWAAEISSW